jgi:opacity protein-like surface antigen
MMKRSVIRGLGITAGVALALAAVTPVPAEAQVVRVTGSDTRHAIGFNLGYFAVRGEDSRVDDDVLLADINDLLFEIGDFSGFTFGGEYLLGVSDYLEVGAGLGFYQKEVPSVYRDFEDIDGSEIAQDLKLRIVPITATVRFLPIGREASVQPYVGAGIGIFNWRYSEVGEFVDFDQGGLIFRQRYEKDGTAVGPVVLAGLRAPVGDFWTVGGEIRWQRAEGDGLFDEGFLADKIDLGGWTTSFNVHFRF